MLPLLTPTDFVALANQTLEMAYPSVEIEGEVLNFKVSRNRWVYFDIADETSKLRCFGTVYILPGPIEDGMKVRIRTTPKLHPQFGFSLKISSIQLSGEGTIKQAADLLFEKLNKEGLFSPERKRLILYPPEKIGLITSEESAAYKDFIKVIGARWGGLDIELANVQVQGESAIMQIVNAIDWFNKQAAVPDVLVVIRGGGSADDLQAFSSEQVTRAVAASRIPTLVAIGHEVDVSLAELAADLRASTPSNAAELLVPDRKEQLNLLVNQRKILDRLAVEVVDDAQEYLKSSLKQLDDTVSNIFENKMSHLNQLKRTLDALSPNATLKRGYAIVRSNGKVIKSVKNIKSGSQLEVQFLDGRKITEVK